ncbi:MAG: hypothetical protein KKB31_07495 [Nanoarchaeota archaeon]|nr:hypothetical protein [Nanoarchaeota archaeon]
MPYTAPTLNAGAVGMYAGGGAGKAISSDGVPLNVAEEMAKWWEHEHPTASLVQRIRKVPTPQETFSHLEDKEVPDWGTYDGLDESSVSNLLFLTAALGGKADYLRLQFNDQLYNPRAGDWRIVWNNSDGNVTGLQTGATVYIKPMGTAGALWKRGDRYIRYSNAFPEGNIAGKSIHTKKDKITGKVQTIRTSSELTYPVAATPMLGEKNERTYQMAKMRRLHKRFVSRPLFLGPVAEEISDTVTDWGHKTSGGLMGTINSHKWLLDGKLYFDDLASFLTSPMYWCGEDCILATSQRVINIITGWGQSSVRISQNEKMWGRNVTALLINGKRLGLFHEKLFDEDPILSRKAVFLDPKNVLYRPHVGNGINFDTAVHMNILKEDGVERFKDEIRTHMGYEFWVEGSFALIENIEY